MSLAHPPYEDGKQYLMRYTGPLWGEGWEPTEVHYSRLTDRFNHWNGGMPATWANFPDRGYAFTIEEINDTKEVPEVTIAHPPYVRGRTYRLTCTGRRWSPQMTGTIHEVTFDGVDRLESETGKFQVPMVPGYGYRLEEIEEAPMTEVLKYTVDGEEFEFPVTASDNVKIDRATFEAFVRDYTTLERQQEPVQYENGLYRDRDGDEVLVWGRDVFSAVESEIGDYARHYGPLTKVEEQ